MKGPKRYPTKMIEDCRGLYLKYNGKQHTKIETEMRARGWPFYRSMLYTTQTEFGISDGWPERFGWTEMLNAETPANARQRNAGRNDFQHWLRKVSPEWTWTWKYQRYIYRQLDEITRKRSKRLMIFLPPRHGKSEMVTVRYAAWRLLIDPKLNIILGSYNQTLANRFSRKIKNVIARSEEHKVSSKTAETQNGTDLRSGSLRWDVGSPFPFVRRRGLDTSAEWETDAGGGVRAVGVGGGIAGFGAGLIIIDDPVRNRADAESRNQRDKVWEWFNDDIYTRMEPDASIILIQTRWHEDDLAGRLLKEMRDGGEHWDVISLPAIFEGERLNEHGEAEADPLGRKPGEALCEKRFGIKALKGLRSKLGSYSFSAMYQQDPAPAAGGVFKREWFERVIDQAPPGLRWKRGYDLAVSTKSTADYTASFRCAFDKQRNLYIADGYRGRIEYPEQRRYIIGRMTEEKMTEHGIEAAMHGKAIVQDLRRERRLGAHALRSVRVASDKLTRALAWLNLAEEGKVFLVRGPWINEFVDEISRFPTGRHDDQIDAVSVAVGMLAAERSKLYVF